MSGFTSMPDDASGLPVCESCRQRQVAEVIASDDPDEPYRVCGVCGERLRQPVLRPLEWFNLAARNGSHKFLLHDDFYDEDGTATLPATDAYSVDGMLASTLDEAAQSLDRLVDYCITRYWLGAPEYDAFRRFEDEAILDELRRRAANGNRHVMAVMLTLCANVLGHAAASWVRAQYAKACHDDMLFSWAEAAARCLPEPEGLHKTIDALGAYAGAGLRERIGALMWFRSPAVLDWIEVHAPRANITGAWGQLAALSGLSLSKVEVWLSRGRPLSLIALDALTQFIPWPGQAPLVRRLDPRLRACPDRLPLVRALQACMAADTAPRASGKCQYLIEHMAELRVE
jgi:hypothetical protein